MYGDDRVRPYAYTYRDYVIRAFNDDTALRPLHPRAARRRPARAEGRAVAAGGDGLPDARAGMFDNNIHDVIDDRIDTVTRGLLGLTVACARCHDHKYDPIPTADYYSLYGVFASSEAPLELPLAGRPENCPAAPSSRSRPARIAPSCNCSTRAYATCYRDGPAARRRLPGRVATTARPAGDGHLFPVAGPGDLRPPIVDRWRKYLASQPRQRPGVRPLAGLHETAPRRTMSRPLPACHHTLGPQAQSAGAHDEGQAGEQTRDGIGFRPHRRARQLDRARRIDTSILSPGTEKIVEQQIPMHRLGTPDEVAKIIYVLCTETSSYVNGAEIHINGGQHV